MYYWSRVSAANERQLKYNITRAMNLILPSLDCHNKFITYFCLYQIFLTMELFKRSCSISTKSSSSVIVLL